MWTEGERRQVAGRAPGAARLASPAGASPVTGEVATPTRCCAVSRRLIREGADAFDEIIISTLPLGISRWVHMDVPARVRAHPTPGAHVVAVHAPA